MEAIVECIWIGKQKVVLLPKFKENQRKAVVNALNHVQLDLRTLLCIIIVIFLDW